MRDENHKICFIMPVLVLIGAVEESSYLEVRAAFEANEFGFLNVTRAILPYFRKQ